MSQMKDSGIKWIGDIPKEWDVKRLKYVTRFLNGYAFNSNDMQTDGEYPVIRIGDIKEGKVILDECLYISNNRGLESYKVRKDDLLLAMSGATVGKVGILDMEIDAYINQRVGIIRSDVTRFIYYVLSTNDFLQHIEFESVGSAQPNISSVGVGKFYIAVPSVKEQKLISSFLDDKIKKIDCILDDLNKQVEILNKYKMSLITETVTKGLNHNVEMKDSEISWIGKIPKHWKIKRLKYLGTARNGLTYSPNDQVDDGILVLRSSNIQNGKFCFDDNVYVDMKIPFNIVLKENDILICSRNGSRNLIGKNALIDSKIAGQTYGAFMCVYRSKYNKFIHYVLNSDIFTYYLSSFLTSTINQLTNFNLYSIKTPFTYDEKEQEQIVKFLDKKCAEIDEIIADKQKQIEKIEKYKKSLIYEYVTGKKRVKGAEELHG